MACARREPIRILTGVIRAPAPSPEQRERCAGIARPRVRVERFLNLSHSAEG